MPNEHWELLSEMETTAALHPTEGSRVQALSTNWVFPDCPTCLPAFLSFYRGIPMPRSPISFWGVHAAFIFQALAQFPSLFQSLLPQPLLDSPLPPLDIHSLTIQSVIHERVTWSITWELVRNVDVQAPPRTHWNSNCILTRSLGISVYTKVSEVLVHSSYTV